MPLFLARNSLHSIRPRPVPFSALVPRVVKYSLWEILSRLAGERPIPLSFTKTSSASSPFSTPICTHPFSGVNLMALDTRLRSTSCIISCCATTIAFFLILFTSLIFFKSAWLFKWPNTSLATSRMFTAVSDTSSVCIWHFAHWSRFSISVVV